MPLAHLMTTFTKIKCTSVSEFFRKFDFCVGFFICYTKGEDTKMWEEKTTGSGVLSLECASPTICQLSQSHLSCGIGITLFSPLLGQMHHIWHHFVKQTRENSFQEGWCTHPKRQAYVEGERGIVVVFSSTKTNFRVNTSHLFLAYCFRRQSDRQQLSSIQKSKRKMGINNTCMMACCGLRYMWFTHWVITLPFHVHQATLENWLERAILGL